MNLAINRLDPNVPDPVESRRRTAGRFVRVAYATIVFGVLAFIVIYFGRPLLYLGGPGVVTSPRFVISLPYAVHVSRMNVTPGSVVQADEEIGQIWSPEQDNIVGNYMRALAEVASSSAELRIKMRVAQESLEAARNYQRETEEAARLIDTISTASTSFRLEVMRERAAARKNVVTQETEIAEATAQLAKLDELAKQVQTHLDDIERTFAGGRLRAPINGIVSPRAARVGESVMAGTPVAEIMDTTDIFVDWYIPNARFADPQVGGNVYVLFGNRRFAGTIAEVLPLSDIFAGTQASAVRERASTQIARVRFSPGTAPPPLNSAVYVHMVYSDLLDHAAGVFLRLFGLVRA